MIKVIFRFLLLLTIISCSGIKNQYKIEKNSPISFKEAYYYRWVSGIKGGGSGINVFLILDSEKATEIQLKGIFFRKKHAELKSHTAFEYRSYLKEESNWEKQEKITLSPIKKTEELNVGDFPFKLASDEAVVSFSKKGKLKYIKIKLIKKNLETKPQ